MGKEPNEGMLARGGKRRGGERGPALSDSQLFHRILARLDAPKPLDLSADAIARLSGRDPHPRRGAVGARARGNWSYETWEGETPALIHAYAQNANLELLPPLPDPNYIYLVRRAFMAITNGGAVRQVGLSPSNALGTGIQANPAANAAPTSLPFFHFWPTVTGNGEVHEVIIEPGSPVPWTIRRGVWIQCPSSCKVSVTLRYHIVPVDPRR